MVILSPGPSKSLTPPIHSSTHSLGKKHTEHHRAWWYLIVKVLHLALEGTQGKLLGRGNGGAESWRVRRVERDWRPCQAEPTPEKIEWSIERALVTCKEYCEQFSLAEHRAQGTEVPEREAGPVSHTFVLWWLKQQLVSGQNCAVGFWEIERGLVYKSPVCWPSQKVHCITMKRILLP